MPSEIFGIINDQQNINLTSQCIKNWPYELKDYSLKKIVSKEKSYTIQKSIHIKENDKDKVLIPNKYIEVTIYFKI